MNSPYLAVKLFSSLLDLSIGNYKFKNESHDEEHYKVRLRTNRLSISFDFLMKIFQLNFDMTQLL